MTRRPELAAGARGFVLVGVVMLILALTILGLSLYGLSSYEAQFLYGSLDHEQAVAHAQGGLYLVDALISAPPNYLLSAAGQAKNVEGITYACAWQIKPPDGTHVSAWVDTAGAISWSDTVHVEVHTASSNETFAVQAQFLPRQNNNPYKRLLTLESPPVVKSYDDIYGGPHPPPQYDRTLTVHLSGDVWQRVVASSDSLWTSLVTWPRPDDGRLVATGGTIPDATTFATTKASGPASDPVGSYPPGSATLTFDASAGNGNPVFFYVPPGEQIHGGPYDGRENKYSYFCDEQTTIRVAGTAVWVLPHGVRFNGNSAHVIARSMGGPNPAVLVIVAGQNLGDIESPPLQNYTANAIWFEGGIDVDEDDPVKVFLITDHSIRIETPDFPPSGLDFDTHGGFCAVAESLWVMGPPTYYPKPMRLTRDATVMDPLTDQLYSAGALPPVTGGITNAFTLVPGSWREH